jgi:hypothetical protein
MEIPDLEPKSKLRRKNIFTLKSLFVELWILRIIRIS